MEAALVVFDVPFFVSIELFSLEEFNLYGRLRGGLVCLKNVS